MATEQQKRDAANKLPKNRSTAEQAMVDDNPSQAVRNADYAARERQRVYGK